MSKLKAVHAFDVYEAYTKTGDDDAAQVYIKSEADKVIARHKYKWCFAMASLSLEKRDCYKALYEKADYDKWCLKWHKRWLEIAEKFKPNSTAQQGKEEVK